MIVSLNNKPYSANVTLSLHAMGRSLDLAKVGPDRITFRVPTELPPCDAVLSVCIDGNTTEQRLRLPDGASVDSASVRVERSE